jgi:hypothetical protein
MKLTERQKQALKIIGDTPNIEAREFSVKFWSEEHHINKSGNKKSWLCAGSYVGKLIKRGWVRYDYDRFTIDDRLYFKGYVLTRTGHEIYENLKQND